MQWLYTFCIALYCTGEGAYGLPQRVAGSGDLCLSKVVKISQRPTDRGTIDKLQTV